MLPQTFSVPHESRPTLVVSKLQIELDAIAAYTAAERYVSDERKHQL